jgi:acyl dehydratase
LGPAFKAALAVLPELELGRMLILHGDQRLRLSAPVPSSGSVETEVLVQGIYDKGSGALIDLACRSHVEGRPLCENQIGFFVPGAGGFGGERGPKAEKIKLPDRAPDFVSEMRTDRRQAVLYRLTLLPDPAMEVAVAKGVPDGHIDPESAGLERPLLYGICTLGFATRAAIREVLAGDPSRIRGMRGRFAAPVHPGQSLISEFWKDESRLLVQMKNDAGAVVLSNAAIELT